MNKEQELYDFLKTIPTEELIERIKQIERTNHNNDIISSMIRNILLYKGEYVSAFYTTDLEYGKLTSVDKTVKPKEV